MTHDFDDDSNYEECGICQNLNSIGQERCDFCDERLSGTAHEVYVEKNFSKAHREVIQLANGFLDEYAADGYKASLRQLYYQFVANVPDFANTEQSYKRLGGIINDAKLAGLIAFSSIEDRGRSCAVPWNQPDMYSVLSGIEYAYSEDYWAEQDYYIEVWVEKDALSGVIERPCDRWKVPWMACKGYMSGSAHWSAGNRFQAAVQEGKQPVLIHLGDHDPSGMDMTRDNAKRLSMFVGDTVDVRRIGLNMDQIRKYDPPPNPTKVTDSRAGDYIAEFGHTSWELDALAPSVISRMAAL